MAEIINCPSCQRRLNLPAEAIGQKVRCPSCQTEFTAGEDVPSVVLAEGPAPAPPPSRPPRRTDPDDDRPRRRASRSVPLPRRRSSTTAKVIWTTIGVAIMAAFYTGLVFFDDIKDWFRKTNNPSPQPVVKAPAPPERPLAPPVRPPLQPVIKDNKPLSEDQIAQQVKPLFDNLGAAWAQNDPQRVATHFNLNRMADELGSLPGVQLADARKRDGFVSRLRLGMVLGMNTVPEWHTSEIHRVKKLNNDDAVVIVRLLHPLHKQSYRWWVTREDGSWKVYDVEAPDTGMRFSVAASSTALEALGTVPQTARALQTLREVSELLTQRPDVATAERKLNAIALIDLPQEVEALRSLLRGRVALQRGQGEEALAALNKARDLRPDLPIVDRLKGQAYEQLKKWDEAVKSFQAYREQIGDDSELCHDLGIALRNANRFAEAATVYRTALDLEPKDEVAFQGLLSSLLPENKIDDLGDRFLRLDDRRTHFTNYAADCERRDLIELMKPIALAMQKADPRYPLPDYCLSLIEARGGHPDKAIPLFQAAMGRMRDDVQRSDCKRSFLRAMKRVGKLGDAYAALPDSREAFHFAAAEAMTAYNLDDLKRIVALHRKNDAADPLLAWYQAVIHVREQRYPLADRSFTAALNMPPDAETLATFRADRVTARYHSGLAMAAYRDIGPQEDTFKQLARVALEDDDYALLEKLLEAHEKVDPLSLDLLRNRCRLKIRQGQTAEAVTAFHKALDRLAADPQQAQAWVSDFLYQMMAAGKTVEGYRAAPDAKKAFDQLADNLLEEGDRLDDLRRLIEAHRKGFPDDPLVALYQGDIDLADKAWDKAADGLWAGMKVAPKDVQERFHWKVVQAFYRAGRWKRAYDDIGPRNQTFTQLANLLEQDKKVADLEALCQAHLAAAGESAELDFYRAMAKVFMKKPAEAAVLIAQACRQPDKEYLRRSYNDRFVREMHNQGLMLEGYRAAPDKAAAFQILAADLVAEKKEKELAELLSIHEVGRQGDRWCDYYRGEWHLLRGEAEKAAERFAAALKQADLDRVWSIRDALCQARVKCGQAVATYRELTPRKQVFQELVSACVEQKDAAQLQALIDAYRKDEPDSLDTLHARLQLHWLKQDYFEVLALLRQHGEDYFDLPPTRWESDSYRVRALVKLKRTDEAIREAEAVVKRHGNHVLLVLAHAAAGDVKGTIAALEPKNAIHLVGTCYRDADLGPILRSDAFRAFRERFPEPK